MRDSMLVLEVVDLGSTTIVAYSGREGMEYGSAISYSPNEMPTFSFRNLA
jgi:hypothetical protein